MNSLWELPAPLDLTEFSFWLWQFLSGPRGVLFA